MKHGPVAFVALVAVALVGCTTGAGLGETRRGQDIASTGAVAAGDRSSGAPVVAVLQTRDRRMTLTAGRDGLRVTVRDGEGGIVARDVRVDELRETDPFLYEVCRSSVAGNHTLDARLDRPAQPPGPPSYGRFDETR